MAAMFVFFGDSAQTQPVEGGLERVMKCPKCGRTSTFRERKVSHQVHLYFVDVFTHGTHHVMECGACGAAFVTDEVSKRAADNDQRGTVYGALRDAYSAGRQRVETAIEDGAVDAAVQQATAKTTEALNVAQGRVNALMSQMWGNKKKG